MKGCLIITRTSVIKNRLVFIEDEITYAEACKILWGIQSTIRSMSNKAVQLCWEWYMFSSDYYKKNRIYPKPKDMLSYNTLMGYVDYRLRNDFYQINSGNRGVTLKYITDKYKHELSDYRIGNKSVPTFEKDMPIDLHNSSIRISEFGMYYIAELSLLSNPYYKELNLQSGRFRFKITPEDNRQRDILQKCANGQYKIGASKLVYIKKNGKNSGYWSLNLVYSFEVEKHETISADIVMGVDMGIAKPVYCAILGSPQRLYIDGGEIDSYRKQIDARRKSIQNQSKWCGDGRRGHGRKTMLEPLQSISDKISNYRDTINDRYSRKVVDFAIKNGVTEIHMEDLTGISADDKFLKHWSYYDLQSKIKYKAEAEGIAIKYINPKYTSQKCHECGYTDAANRPKDEKGQAYFKCVKCGNKANADYNAALNIAESTDFVEKGEKGKYKKNEGDGVDEVNLAS